MQSSQLIAQYPQIYHMAEVNSWPTIQSWGLLSTSAALDRFNIRGPERVQLEMKHRPDRVELKDPEKHTLVLRDQKPMFPTRLQDALPPDITPSDWYSLINGKVFFWAEEHRLERLLNARQYRNFEHDVLTICTRSLIEEYEQQIWLCHMNSGNTFPMPHARDRTIFSRLADYPTKRDGRPKKEVVEVTVDYAVPNVLRHTLQVRRMHGREVKAILWQR